ncbi:MAG TPA: lysophospholipid acyltransferase family protein [Thermoanaerobaculia bacterium]|nr:lysophospholipid acyltransferase family protein [Thermoanaerobaculia bacterium]
MHEPEPAALDAGPRSRPLLASWLATLGANAYLVAGGVVFGVAAIVASWIPPRRRFVFPVARAWARGLLLASGVAVRVARTASLPSSVVFMANHQSLYDIAVMLVSVPVPIRFLAKRSLFRIPVFGWALGAAGFVPIDRVDRSRAREAFQLALDTLEGGVAIVIYPEETRSLDGRIRPFRRGGFLMALKAHAPIVPVGIRGTLRVRPKGRFLVEPAQVEVAFGDPIDGARWGVRRIDGLIEQVEEEVVRLAQARRADAVETLSEPVE